MAHIDTGGGSGRQKNIELNLVPFIDLMSVLITFLLITAVWTQVSMMQIGSSIYGKRTEDFNPEPPPKVDLALKLDVLAAGYRLTVGSQTFSLPKIGDDYDAAQLLTQLQAVKIEHPEKVDAVITVADALPYRTLIEGMDHLLLAGFPQISVATGGPADADTSSR